MTEKAPPRVDAQELRRPAPRPVRWMRAHPVVVDAVVALVACAPLLVAAIVRGDAFPWWGYPLIGLTAGVLMLRRRRPFAVLIAVAVTCALNPLAEPGYGFPTTAFAFALYTVASRQSTRRALAGYGIAIVIAVIATIPYSLAGTPPPLVSLTDPLSLIALVVGFLVKNRRDHERWLTETVNQRIEHAALAERSRIAAEMHDVVAHSLTVIVALAGGASNAWTKRPEQAKSAVDQIGAVGREALEEMQRTLKLLRDSDAELDENLHHSGSNLPTLDELADRFRQAGLPVTVTRTGPPLPGDTALRHTVYRIVQESLTNTLRHAIPPRSATVTIDHRENAVELTVEDDGRPAPYPPVPGHGLVGIQQRAAAHGGHAESTPRTGGGWRTRATLPTLGGRREGLVDDARLG